jgi:hypothetical protein
MRRVSEEILQRVGKSKPSYDDVRDMKYLRAFINGLHSRLFAYAVPDADCFCVETLRLYPVVPFDGR